MYDKKEASGFAPDASFYIKTSHFAPEKPSFAALRGFCHSFCGIVLLGAEGIPDV